MSNQPIDPIEFQTTQRTAWSSVASGWSEWWNVFELGTSNLNRRLVEQSGAVKGDHVLDVATGVGEPALTAAKVVGPSGRVTACDLSPEMIRFAAERAQRAELTNIEFIEVDAHELDFEAESFDAAVSRWGLMLMLDPARVLTHIHAALKPKARLAASVWADPKTAPFLATPMRAARVELGLESPPDDAPGPFRLAEKGALAALLIDAGFQDVSSEIITVHMNYASFAEYRSFLGDLSSSFKRMLSELTHDQREAVWNAVERETDPYKDEAGRLLFANNCWCVWGTKA
ncbi:MAG: ubiquinone/menaquinone biosynthesis C-methylase UbiE [Planctomycetota bacterium]|jgi:ubiquinone/menaquinone biosynthesis C-methylase UbiE